MKRALILGSTGLVGQILLKKILDDDYFTSTTALVRKPTGISHTKYFELVVDFEKLNQPIDAEIVFCCLGTTMKIAGSKEAFRKVDFKYPTKIAELQKSISKKFILISSLGANPNSAVFYNQTKGQTEEALKKMNYESLVILRPSLIDGNREKTNQPARLGEKVSSVLFKALNPLLIGHLARYRAVTPDKIANQMIKQAKSQTVGITVIESENI